MHYIDSGGLVSFSSFCSPFGAPKANLKKHSLASEMIEGQNGAKTENSAESVARVGRLVAGARHLRLRQRSIRRALVVRLSEPATAHESLTLVHLCVRNKKKCPSSVARETSALAKSSRECFNFAYVKEALIEVAR